ncbi:ABC transporter G member 42 [Ancistrocladus abbreviatus]
MGENRSHLMLKCHKVMLEDYPIAPKLEKATSKKDQEQYWADRSHPYRYISVNEFVRCFKAFHVGKILTSELSISYDRGQSHKAALVFSKNDIPTLELLKASFDKEWLLLRRQAPVYIFKAFQLIIVALIGSTVFLRTEIGVSYENESLYVGALIFSMLINMFNGFAELSITIRRLPIFYKHRDLLFHPAWAFSVPNFLLGIPLSVIESIVWSVMTYYTIGYTPEATK